MGGRRNRVRIVFLLYVLMGGAKGVLGGATAPPETLSAPPLLVLREFKVYLGYIVFVLNRITSLLKYIRN